MADKRFLTLIALSTFLLATGALSQELLLRAAPGSPFGVGDKPTDMAVGDLNKDGRPDLVTPHSGSRNVTVLLGDGRGFRQAPGSPFSVEMVPHLVAIADFNLDGTPDLAFTGHDDNGVTVVLGRGNGEFMKGSSSHFMAISGTQPHNHGLAVGDVNEDGAPDLVTSNYAAGNVSVLLGDGRGGFAAAAGSPFQVGKGPYPLALGDVNGDDHLDIITPNVAGNSVSVLLGNGRAGFTDAPGSPYRVETRPYFAALGDIDRDGRPDIVASHDDIHLVSVLIGDGRGGFSKAPQSPIDIRFRGGEIRLADIDGDGKIDLATGTSGNNVVVLLGNGAGAFASAAGSPYAAGAGPWALEVADLNQDGKLDLVTANFESDNLTVWLRK